MSDFLDKLPVISDRTVPENWDHNEAGLELQESIKNFRTVTAGICKQIWVARIKLSQPGKRTDLSNNGTPTFEQWLRSNKFDPRTASRWLERYDPLTNSMLPPKQEQPKPKRLSENFDPENSLTNVTPNIQDNHIDIEYKNSTYVECLSIAHSELNHPQEHKELTETDAVEVVQMLGRISRKANKLKNDIEKRFKLDDKSTLENNLFQAAKMSFLSKSKMKWSPDQYKIEVPKLWELVNLCTRAEDPINFLEQYIQTVYELTEGADKFWKNKPFVPSAFVTPKMEPYVLKAIDNRGDKQVKAEIMDNIKGIYSK